MVAWPTTPVPSEVQPVQLIHPMKTLEYDSGHTYTTSIYSKGLRRWELFYVFLNSSEKNLFIRFLADIRLSAEVISWTHPHAQTITNATNASPIVITTAFVNNFYDEDMVVVSGVTGNTAANGTHDIDSLSSTTFSLLGTTGNGAYTGGGEVRLHIPRVRIEQKSDSFDQFSKTIGPDVNDRGVYTLSVELEEYYDVETLS